MLTPQDIKDRKLVKAVFGGYDMQTVEDFLEEINKDYQSLYKENQTLKGKLKVLVDKIDEYRSVDDSMRKALYTAQNMANEIVAKAKAEKDELLANAKVKASEYIAELKEKIRTEEEALESARTNSREFLLKMEELYKIQSQALVNFVSSNFKKENAQAKAEKAAREQAAEAPVEPPAPAPEIIPEPEPIPEPVPEPIAPPESEPVEPVSQPEPVVEAPAPEPEPVAPPVPEPSAPEEDPFATRAFTVPDEDIKIQPEPTKAEPVKNIGFDTSTIPFADLDIEEDEQTFETKPDLSNLQFGKNFFWEKDKDE